jgi:hypothetical protein
MTCAVRVPACAMLLEENWSRSNSCSVTDLSKPTERYLGSRQRLVSAVNDKIGLEPDFGL